jgi:hypothetical protein
MERPSLDEAETGTAVAKYYVEGRRNVTRGAEERQQMSYVEFKGADETRRRGKAASEEGGGASLYIGVGS